MKKILAPTDFSESGNNAVKYAAGLASGTGAQLIIMNVSQAPLLVNEAPISVITEADALMDVHAGVLSTLKAGLINTHPGLKISQEVRFGLPSNEIREVAAEENADLIVMGISGSGSEGQALLGSVSVDMVRLSGKPVIMVPSQVKYKLPNKIIMAFDQGELTNEAPVRTLTDFAKEFGSKIFIVHISSYNKQGSSNRTGKGADIEDLLADVSYSVHSRDSFSVVEGINDFVTEKQACMIAMIAHEHNFFYRLFNRSHTKKLAFHTEVPLLAIPDKAKQYQKPASGTVTSEAPGS